MRNVADPVSFINERTYLESLHTLTKHVASREDRTNTGTYSEFGTREVYDISDNRLPLLSTKFIHYPSIAHELIWMLRGESSIKYLKDNKVNIWDNWLVPNTEVYDKDNNLIDAESSSIYGESWRRIDDTRVLTTDQLLRLPKYDVEGYPLPEFKTLGVMEDGRLVVQRTIDQIDRIRWQLKNTPTSRRILLNAYNPSRVSDVILPPCHLLAQFYVKEGKLDCQVYLRSNDTFLGKPYNLAQYATLTHILAAYSGLQANRLIYLTGDTHLYKDHLEAAKVQLSRVPKMDNKPKLELSVDINQDPSKITIDQLTLTGYTHHTRIPAPIAK